jgi:hypothetical protein
MGASGEWHPAHSSNRAGTTSEGTTAALVGAGCLLMEGRLPLAALDIEAERPRSRVGQATGPHRGA